MHTSPLGFFLSLVQLLFLINEKGLSTKKRMEDPIIMTHFNTIVYQML